MKQISTSRRKLLACATTALSVVGITGTAAAQHETQNTTSSGDANSTDTSENSTDSNNGSSENVTEDDSDGDTEPATEDDSTTDEEKAEDSDTSGSDESDSGDTDSCTGAPQMSRTSITTPQGRITEEDPATVEANFRVDPNVPQECTVNIDLQYSFSQSGFQFGGGSGWEQSATDIVATTFTDLQSGEIRSIDAQIYTNGAEPGDQITVVADYEIWYDGNRDQSFQQSGIRETVEVEAINEPEDDTEAESGSTISDYTPGFGITSSIAALGSAGYLIKRRLSVDD